MAEIHKGDIGTIFRLTLKDGGSLVDVNTAGSSEKFITFKKPSGKTVTVDAAFPSGEDGTQGRIEYITTTAGFLDEVGHWEMQAKLILALSAPSRAATLKSEIEGFHVKRNLD